MKDKIFLDTNILIYSFSNDAAKKHIANDLLKKKPIISIQVLNELSSVLKRKLNIEINNIKTSIEFLSKICKVKNVTTQTIQSALDIVREYKFSYYDSLIVSSALENNCECLYTEDLTSGQIIRKELTIINPFI